MDFPLFQNPWDASSNGRIVRSFRGIPVQVKPEAWPPRSFKPKTVSIPVRFVGSELSRSKSAINIQKVLRGFLVRKSVKKIMAIREQVNEMERSVSKTETVELIRKDSKERLRVNENLMRLLLKLDSVRGVDSCVRDLRKSVIKKAIALQEIVDAIISDDHSVDSSSAEAADQNQGIIDSSGD
ncbi:BAG family molecular chaperone regulator 5, mitochondrial-like [Hibiscus syriacus]|uniref:BAG family molecular chaperone regulator 5, mitochondrial-like n=1 Tax=Hibiscus syriacus TaxID=106335 RepID=UPI00192442D2|nr:BAG family molecular chaperone regulator 5, mitochondrial-like [Hibiscus syriacus]